MMDAHVDTGATFFVDLAGVGREDARRSLLILLDEILQSPATSADFWSSFPHKSDRTPERTLVIADLHEIVKKYQSTDFHSWIAFVRQAQPYFLALVRTKRDQHYADLVDDLMRHSDLRMSVCREMKRSGFHTCLREAVSALDPNAVIDVRYAPSADRLWVAFSDGAAGFVDWERLQMKDLLDELLLESATVGSQGGTVEILTRDGDAFEVDALSIKALFDPAVADSLAGQASKSDMEVGQRVRSARLASQLSQAEIGRAHV